MLCALYAYCAAASDTTSFHAQKVMKQMLKPFKPAEPRFEGLNTEVSEETGAVVLLDSAAYLACTVKNRLEVRMCV